jgi:copper(I)-binding protein
MKRLLTLTPMLIACLAFSAQAAAPKVAVSEAWCRSAAAGAMTGACYLTLTAKDGDKLLSVETPVAASADIHDMDMTGGVMRMRKLDGGLDLPKGKVVALSPGGKHLMLMGLKSGLPKGGQATLTLKFAKAGIRTVSVPIR